MNNLDVECGRIECRRKALLGIDADAATSVENVAFRFQSGRTFRFLFGLDVVAGWCERLYLFFFMITPGSERLPEATL